MERLPQELFDEICNSLSADDLRSAYYVSTKFRKAAKHNAHKFRNDRYEVKKEVNLDKFVSHYSGFRLRYLKHVQLEVHFPKPKDEQRGCFESEAERHDRDSALTEQVRWIFEILSLIELRAGEQNYGAYRLLIHITDYVDDICRHREHAQWRTHLLQPEDLPELNSVVSLHIDNGDPSTKLGYRTQIDLAKRLPNLEYLSCSMGQDEWTPHFPEEPAKWYTWDYDGLRRDSRHDFSKAIALGNIPQSLREVELDFLCRSTMSEAQCIHQWNAMPNLVSPCSKDPFSTGLRLLSYHLRRMVLRAQVDDTLFWPCDGTTPHWPNLEHISLIFHTVSPSGTWYFNGPRGEGRDTRGYELNDSSYPPSQYDEDDEEYCDCREGHRSFQGQCAFLFRISPNEEILGPFLTSFAKATAHMPKLQRAVLWSPLGWEVETDDEAGPAFDYFEPPEKFIPLDGFAWTFVYEAPGLSWLFATNPGQENCEARQIWWKVGNWRPSEELHSLLKQVGSKEHGKSLKEYWDDDQSRQGFGYRYDFEDFTPEEISFVGQDRNINKTLKSA